MPENEESASGPQSSDAVLQEMKPQELDRLADLVYRLLKEEILRGRERRGESMARSWR